MSVFRPISRAVGPDGREWEIYAYRLRVRKREATYDPGLADGEPLGAAFPYMDLLDAILWFFGLIARLVVRVLWDVPRAGLAALGSDNWTVEAVTWYPQPRSHRWSTQRIHRREVVAEVAHQIAGGQLPPSPRHARYIGDRT